MQDAIRTYAGDCTVRYSATDERTLRGTVLVLVKPDNTVLVHDADGYQPAAWLTRADTVRVSREDGLRLVATDGDERLVVEATTGVAHGRHPVSPAGPMVGTCPDCAGALVRAGGAVVCTGCLTRHGVPRDATVLESSCPECGLPRMAVERGARFEVCVDHACEPLDAAVVARFDGEWDCPDCGRPLAVGRERSLNAACQACGDRYTVPAGVVTGRCACGLPHLETPGGQRCLDPDCDRGRASEEAPDGDSEDLDATP